MKKTLFSGLAVLAIAAVAAGNVNFNSQTKGMSDLALANVEALADSEYDDDYNAAGEKNCVKTIEYGGIYPNRSCETCCTIWFTYGSNLSTCTGSCK